MSHRRDVYLNEVAMFFFQDCHLLNHNIQIYHWMIARWNAYIKFDTNINRRHSKKLLSLSWRVSKSLLQEYFILINLSYIYEHLNVRSKPWWMQQF